MIREPHTAGLTEAAAGEAISSISTADYAPAAARVMVRFSGLSAANITMEAVEITSDICIYTNDRITFNGGRFTRRRRRHCACSPCRGSRPSTDAHAR